MTTYDNQNRNFERSQPMDAMGLIWSFCNVYCTSIAVFIRKDFGQEALSSNSVYALLVLIFLAAQDPAFQIFLGLFFIAQVYRRIQTLLLLRRGVVWHSRYAGYPYLAMKCPFVRKEETAKGIIEPMMCFLAGVTLMPLSEPVGLYVFWASLSFLMRAGIEREIARKRKLQMQDAKIEHEWYSDDLRS